MFLFFAMATLDSEQRSFIERLFLEYKGKIYNIAFSILKNHYDAEDALIQVMMNIITHSEKFFRVPRIKIDAQIVIYSRNAAINIYNKNKKKANTEISTVIVCDEEIQGLEIEDYTFNVEKIVLNHEKSDVVRKYLLLLPLEYQDAVDLVYDLGYSYKEAANILNTTTNALALKLLRAKKKLIELGGDELYDYL